MQSADVNRSSTNKLAMGSMAVSGAVADDAPRMLPTVAQKLSPPPTVDRTAAISAAFPRILTRIGKPPEPPEPGCARGLPAWDDALVNAQPDFDALAQSQPEQVFGPQAQW